MTIRPLQGVVLAAGLGTRLRPLTERFPKPLIPFCGATALELALWRLQQIDVSTIAVNAHHLSEQLDSFVRANPFQQSLKLSLEPVILGTGGVYNPLREWQGEADLVVMNGDIISDIDLGALVERHRASGSVATMALLPAVIPGESAVYHTGGYVTAIGFKDQPVPASATGAAAGNFACVQVLSKGLIDLLPRDGSFDVITRGYMQALERVLKVGAYIHSGFWHDLRTPAFFWQAIKAYLALGYRTESVGVRACRARRGLRTVERDGVLFDQFSRVTPTALLGPNVVIETGCTIGDEATIRNAVLLPGAVVAPRTLVENVILGDKLRIAIA